MALVSVTPPAATPISVAEAKLHLRVDHDADDGLIDALVQAAAGHIDGRDGWLGRCLMPQTWDLVLEKFPTGGIRIPLAPLLEIESVKYIDDAGVTQTVAPEGYRVDDANVPGWVVPVATGWPVAGDTINAVRVRFRAGYEGQETDSPPGPNGVPAPIKAALKLLVGHWYANREAVNVGNIVSDLPWAVSALLTPYRLTWLG